MIGYDLLVLLAYASLLVEIVAFPIPSEASTWQLLTSSPAAVNGDDALARARRRGGPEKVVRYQLPTVSFVLVFLLPLAFIAWPQAREWFGVRQGAVAAVAGATAVVVGRAMTFVSVLQLRRARAAGGSVPGGLFRASRNPGLVGMFAFYLGLCAIYASPVLLLGVPLYFVNMNGRVRLEEAHLEARLGQAWRDYRGRVPRYLPVPGLR
jgi:protein-S-isoprenylcysteine O-methyltransferase Ste14